MQKQIDYNTREHLLTTAELIGIEAEKEKIDTLSVVELLKEAVGLIDIEIAKQYFRAANEIKLKRPTETAMEKNKECMEMLNKARRGG